jgi:formamidase
MKSITVDYSKRLAEEPGKGHNRWHESIAPLIEAAPGEEVEIQTFDAFDGQIGENTTAEDLRRCDLNRVHPLTGPVYVAGAAPGDLLEVEIPDMKPSAFGYTVQVPGFGFLRDAFPEPYIAKWRIKDGFAESADLRGVRIPDVARLSGSSASRLQRRCARRSSAAKPTSSAAAGWCCRPRKTARCRRRSRSPRRRCARSRRARTAAISTSSS